MPPKARTVEVVSKAVDLARAMRQKNQIELNSGTGAMGEAQSVAARETEASAAVASLERPAVAGPSMEAVVERENLKKALAQVKRNKGAPGIDGMTVEDLSSYLKEHWLTIRVQLLAGTYKPQPVRRVEIPKASGGLRPLGIPPVLDRFLQILLPHRATGRQVHDANIVATMLDYDLQRLLTFNLADFGRLTPLIQIDALP